MCIYIYYVCIYIWQLIVGRWLDRLFSESGFLGSLLVFRLGWSSILSILVAPCLFELFIVWILESNWIIGIFIRWEWMVINLYLNLVTFIIDFIHFGMLLSWYQVCLEDIYPEAKLVFFIPINEVRFDYYYINQYCYLTLQFSYSTLSCTATRPYRKERHRDLQ